MRPLDLGGEQDVEADGFAALRSHLQAAFLAEMPGAVSRLQWSADRIERRQREGLRALLAHAIEHSPFHRRRLRGVDAAAFELDDLAQLPVMTKAEMMDDLGDVYTDRRLAPDLVEAALAQTTTDPVPILGQYLALTTGGSSGRRGVFVFDAWAAVQFMTSLTRALFVRVQAAGGPPPGGLTIAMIGAPSAVHATGSAAPWTAGGLLPFRFVGVPVTQPLDDIVDQLNAIDAPALAGYPTVLARLAAERLRGRLRIRPRTVSSTSETLDPLLRAAIAEAFEVPVVDMFGSTEGLVGISAPDDATLVFNSDVCITELVDEDHRPVPAGTPSAKVLVTNLSNRTQPLIRYELNDSFVRQPDAPDHGHLRATVQGRADELLRYAGVDVHPVVVRSVLVKEPAVLDYQVHQTARGIDVAALAGERLDEQRLRVRLVRALGDAGLRDPAVTVRSVATLKRHHESGKLQRFFLLS